jgi:DnaD/phage-associated family protein
MSIRVMAKVWQEAPVKANELLLLLAIADNANDAGWAWPGKEYLAGKIRVERRSVDRIANRLMEAGEMDIYHRVSEVNQDEDYTNAYHLKKYGDPGAQPPIDLRGKLGKKPLTPSSGGDDTSVGGGMTPASGGDDTSVGGGMTPASGGDDTSVESSESSLEPSGNSSVETTTKQDVVVERPEIFSVFEQNIGPLTPMIVDSLKDLVKDHTEAWVTDAIKEAVSRGARNLKYIEAILSNWRASGRDSKKSAANGKQPAAEKPVAAPKNAALEAAIAEELAKLPEVPPADYQPNQPVNIRIATWNAARRNMATDRAKARLGVSA